MSETGTCRAASCQAPILWAITSKGRRMPLDPGPNLEGNVVLDRRQDPPLATVLTAYGVSEARARGDALYTPHFATCPARKKAGRG